MEIKATYESKLLTGWTFEADDTAPVISTVDDALNLSETYNNTVAMESFGEKIVLVDLRTKKQVATVGGELETTSRLAMAESMQASNADALAYAQQEVEYYLEHGSFRAGAAALKVARSCPPTCLFLVQSCKWIGGNQCGFCASVVCLN